MANDERVLLDYVLVLGTY